MLGIKIAIASIVKYFVLLWYGVLCFCDVKAGEFCCC